MKTDIDQSQIINLQHFSEYLDCPNNHFLLEKPTFEPIPYTSCIKNNTHQKSINQKSYKTDPFPLIEKENLTDNINLSGPPNNDSKYTINHVFNLHDPLDTTPLSKLEIEIIFLPITEKITLKLLQKHQNLHPVIRKIKFWHKNKTKPIKANIAILGNKTLLR